jgi:DNA-binding CsgD family transcriptional regulator
MAAIASRDLLRALGTLDAIARGGDGTAAFAASGVRALPRLVPSDLTLLSSCDLAVGRRRIAGIPPDRVGVALRDAFDRRLAEHPLVVAYRCRPGPATCRLSDAIGMRAFLDSALYAEYYRPLGVRHAVAVPLHADRRRVVSFVLHRDGPPYSVAERTLLDLARPQLAALYRLATLVDARIGPPVTAPLPAGLTPREREVVAWLGAGKTNREIAAILDASPRTVEKHLEHVYVKLGVETRTAAVMRATAAHRIG